MKTVQPRGFHLGNVKPRPLTLAWILSAALAASILGVAYRALYPGTSFHLSVTLAVIAALVPPAVVNLGDAKRKRDIDASVPRLLMDLAESQEAGMTIYQALEESAKRKYGPITGELRRMIAQISWGIGFEEALESFAERIGTPMTRRATTLVLGAIRIGGDLRTTFRVTAAFVTRMLEMRKERESQQRPYLMIVYATTAIFIAIIFILYHAFFLPISTGQAESTFLKLPMTLEAYKALIHDMTLVVAFFSGLLGGKMGEGSVMAGPKHSAILLSAVLVTFTFIL